MINEKFANRSPATDGGNVIASCAEQSFGFPFPAHAGLNRPLRQRLRGEPGTRGE